MNRRRFLSTLVTGLAGAAATAAIDPEQLLWEPGKKTIFLPPPKKVEMFDVVFLEKVISLEEFKRRYIDPAVKAMADEIDRKMLREIYMAARALREGSEVTWRW